MVRAISSTQLKNGFDVMKCLKNERLVKPAVPELLNEHTTHKKRVWEYCMGELMKTEKVLEGNLCKICAVQMSLCDSDTKNKGTAEYQDLEKKLDFMALLAVIKHWYLLGVLVT